ncbi:WYL domain-containing protein [Rheinheimera texasensis]|uniref:WYL domain-containing protein n=1 Tax=Rheinheimera texasensis TaxID=306205 RepID=UPI0004E19759|nr:WYL domain-containing protein [Rheinheimera texasensis]
MTDPFNFSDEELFDALPSNMNTTATLTEICRKLCIHKMRDFAAEQQGRKLEQKVRRHLHTLAIKYPKFIEIDVEAKPQLYRKKADINASNKQTIRQLSVLQDLIGQYLPVEQQRALEHQATETTNSNWKQFIYVAPASICTAPKCSIEVKTTIYTAIEQQQALVFTYLNHERKIRQKKLMPWGLMFKGEKTYVIGVETHSNEPTPFVYAMHRMSHVSILDAEPHFYAKPTNMLLSEICRSKGLDRFKRPEDKFIQLTLWLFGSAANNIDGTPISDDQVVVEIAEGVRELRATVLWGDELEKFIRGLGPNAEVIEPLDLRQKLAKEYEELALRYANNQQRVIHTTA